MTDLTIIIISYNTKDLLRDCLQSIFKYQDSEKLEVIVIDNASTDGSPELIQKHFSPVKLIRNKSNVGFARANNQAAKLAASPYLLFLNSDTQFLSGTLPGLMQIIEKHAPDIASCRLLNNDHSIQPQGGALPHLLNLKLWMLFLDDIPFINRLFLPYQQNRPTFFTRDHKVGWVGGTAMLVRTPVFAEIGGFDEQIFMYGEDVELCYRARQAGFKVRYFKEPEIIHLGHGSSSSSRAFIGEYQGLLYLFQKHKPAWQLPILKVYLIIGALLRILLFGIIGRDETKRQTYEKALDLARS